MVVALIGCLLCRHDRVVSVQPGEWASKAELEGSDEWEHQNVIYFDRINWYWFLGFENLELANGKDSGFSAISIHSQTAGYKIITVNIVNNEIAPAIHS